MADNWRFLIIFQRLKCGVPTGIRTPVAAVKGRCPRPLDDGDIGGARRDRTADLYNAIVALSQLSYSPGKARYLTEYAPLSQTPSSH